MSLIVYIIILALVGLIVGAFARLALPGKDPMTIPRDDGGRPRRLVRGGHHRLRDLGRQRAPGFLASLVFSTLIVYVIRRRRGGGLVDPGVPGRRDR